MSVLTLREPYAVSRKKSRPGLLLFCLFVSLVLHLLFVSVSLRWPVTSFNEAGEAALRRFRVHLTKYEPPPTPPSVKPMSVPVPAPVLPPPIAADTQAVPSEVGTVPLPSAVPFEEGKLAERPGIEVAPSFLPPLEAIPPEKTGLPDLVEVKSRVVKDEVAVVPRRLVAMREKPGEVSVAGGFGTGSGSGPGSGQGQRIALPPASILDQGFPERVSGPGADGRDVAIVKPPRTLGESPLAKLELQQDRLRDRIEGPQGIESLDRLLSFELFTYHKSGEEEGYFRLRISPKTSDDLPLVPKEMVYVVDCSKSILPPKLAKSISGVQKSLYQLNPEDIFNVVAFRQDEIRFKPKSVPATPENVRAAAAFLNGLEPFGETDVYRALFPMVAEPTQEGYVRNVILISDGKPTTGETSSRAIINSVTDTNNLQCSIFAFAGGTSFNQYLLELLAYRNKGIASHAPQIAIMDEEFPRFCGSLRYPVLTSIRSYYTGGVNLEEVFPKAIPDFYVSRDVNIYGRFRSQDKMFSLRLVGNAGTAKRELIFQKEFSSKDNGGPEIARDWAFNKAYHIIGELCRRGEDPQLSSDLTALKALYGVTTAYTIESSN